ncbi:MAG: hypothetical protein ACR2NR_00270 [Solirubrobacteraceae bacterium]
MSPLSQDQQDRVRKIEAAVGESDRAVRDHLSSLDAFERSAVQSATGNVSIGWLQDLDQLRTELLGARDRLDNLNTGLRAQDYLRKSLIETAAGVAAWRFALGSSDPREIAAARVRMRDHFAAAEIDGMQGASDLKQGR